MLDGEIKNDVIAGGFTFRPAVLVVAPRVAEIVALTVESTPEVFTVNDADVAPEATVTEAGTVAQALSEESATVVPPDGAGPLRVTVPPTEFPPVTEFWERVTLAKPPGVIVRLL